MKVNLGDIAEAILAGSDTEIYYLNTVSGEIILDAEDIHGKEREALEDLLDEVWDDLIELPNQRDLDGYRMMWDFVRELPKGQASQGLSVALKGQGAFGRFKTACKNFGLLERWYEYEDNRVREFARTWCLENGIELDTPIQLSIRHAGWKDIDALIALRKKQLGVTDDSLDFSLQKYFRDHIRDDSLYEMIVWQQEEPAACGGLAFFEMTPDQDGRNHAAWLVNFYAEDNEYKNTCLEMILGHLLQVAREMKIEQVYCQEKVFENMEQAGFEVCSSLWQISLNR
ncbi:MAG: hypothetical protein HUJ55_06470 [Ileibacterium sp.]|nr:hypothetical protein [Ileibacterium sp.]